MLAKRLSLSLLAVAAVSLIVTAASMALFTASTANTNNTFSTGTVSLVSPATMSCNVSNIAPGDSGICGSYTFTYTGSLQAWLGLDAASGGALLGGPTPMIVTISDGTNSYNPNAGNQVMGKFNTGNTVTVTVGYSLPLAAGNAYQGTSGGVTFTIHAVQVKNNDAGSGPISW